MAERKPKDEFSWSADVMSVETAEASIASILADGLERFRLQHTVDSERGLKLETTVVSHDSFIEALGAMSREAAISIHRNYKPQFFVTIIEPDRRARLATITRRLANAGCAIEGAAMKLIAGQAVAMLLVSGRRGYRQEDLKNILSPKSDTAPPVVIEPLRSADPAFPRSHTSQWQLCFRIEDRQEYLQQVLLFLAEEGIPLTSMSTWIDVDQRLVVDLNYAMSSVIDENLVASDLRVKLSSFGADFVRLRPTLLQTHASVQHFAPVKNDVMVVSVVGVAMPGLVFSCLNGLGLTDDSPRFHLVGSAMAILETQTALTMILENVDGTHFTPDEEEFVSTLINENIDTFDNARVRAAYVLPGAHVNAVPEQPTHTIRWSGREQVGVLGEITEILANCKANIVWMASRVTDVDREERCQVDLDVSVFDEHVEEMDVRLRRLGRDYAAEIFVEPWIESDGPGFGSSTEFQLP